MVVFICLFSAGPPYTLPNACFVVVVVLGKYIEIQKHIGDCLREYIDFDSSVLSSCFSSSFLPFENKT